MRPRSIVSRPRAAQAAVGIASLAVPATALALSGATGGAAESATLNAHLSSQRVAYHRTIALSGQAPASEAGRSVSLELQPAGTRGWRRVASTRVRPDGRFRLTTWLRRSGALRAVGEWTQEQPPGVAPHASGSDPASTSTATSSTTSVAAAQSRPSSTPQRVWVRAKLEVPRRALAALGSQAVSVRGRLLPGQPGRRVVLQELRAGRWLTVSGVATGRRGEFDLRYQPQGATERRLRVKFDGDRENTATNSGAGTVTVYTSSLASWYDDAGSTACGFHSTYGVANRSLPCGTKVRFYYHGRGVTAVVEDRGPFTGGRDWDLNQNLAQALGFDGVGTVWTAVTR